MIIQKKKDIQTNVLIISTLNVLIQQIVKR